MATALLIIDVQRALCSGEYACFEINRVIENINHLSTRARIAGVPVVFIQHEEEAALWYMTPTAGNWPKAWKPSPRIITYAKPHRIRSIRPTFNSCCRKRNSSV